PKPTAARAPVRRVRRIDRAAVSPEMWGADLGGLVRGDVEPEPFAALLILERLAAVDPERLERAELYGARDLRRHTSVLIVPGHRLEPILRARDRCGRREGADP